MAAWVRQTGDQPCLDGVAADVEDHGRRARHLPGTEDHRPLRDEQIDAGSHQLRSQIELRGWSPSRTSSS